MATRAELVNAIEFLKYNSESATVLEYLAGKYGAKVNPEKTISENSASLVTFLMQFTGYIEQPTPMRQPSATRPQLEFQPYLDLNQYSGKWFDAASIPQPFDRGTPWKTAEYRILPQKTKRGLPVVEVKNTSYNEDGSVRGQIIGTAEVMDPENLAALYVSFPTGQPRPANPTANYLVHHTDYVSYAIVGSYDGSNLYFLVRQRPIGQNLYTALLKHSAGLGYDVSKLVQDYGAVQ